MNACFFAEASEEPPARNAASSNSRTGQRCISAAEYGAIAPRREGVEAGAFQVAVRAGRQRIWYKGKIDTFAFMFFSERELRNLQSTFYCWVAGTKTHNPS